jgi:hypothetical protein
MGGMGCQAELLTHRNSAVSRGIKEGWVAVDGHGYRWLVAEVVADSHRQNGDAALYCSTSLLSCLGLKDEVCSISSCHVYQLAIRPAFLCELVSWLR